ncbi:DUF3618 domain-containing protein [Nocardioides acrostichi]|uniref:DUF3618 domain-containing protein n=1 Tax=Nocardioides acrostichi TaxID=2784339 RepID=A0A930USM9_9ACTN|nr:DUF3618 domain-containing protein [Nocardioides acrostichi]MBF4160108.1 DUF3618 domain-containing protein [Nocardioides acrostichi]
MSTDPKAIEREIEQARERLAATIDQLAHRASPKTIANREAWAIKAHYVDPETGEPRTEAILKTVGIVVGTVAALVILRKFSR